MRVVRVHQPGGVEALMLEELPMPTPQTGAVLVRALSIGVGRPDVLIRNGTYKWMPPLPATPGAEMVGVVEALGQGVSTWQVGERVLISARELPQRGGCYAQAICVDQAAPFRLPESIAADDALSLPNLQLSLALLQAAGVQGPKSDGQEASVLITGAAGGVATMLSQLAKHWGFRCFGTVRSNEKRDFAKRFAFDAVFDSTPETLVQQVIAATNNRGADIAFDHLGGDFLPACMRSLAPKGQAISYNIITGLPTQNIFALQRELLQKSLSVQCFSMHTYDSQRSVRRGMMERAIALMAQGAVKAPPATRYRLDDVRITHEILDRGATLGKLVLHP